jgi:hypothetical protein
MKSFSNMLWILTLFTFVGSSCGKKSAPVLPEKIAGHCTYVNKFSKKEECRDYVGEWSAEQAQVDCRDQNGAIVLDAACNIEVRLGACILTTDANAQRFQRITFPGDDATKCAGSERGCEFFGGGVFEAAPICGGATTPGGGSGLAVFQQPKLVCKAPLPGEAPGKSPNGQVCTWQMISGATEEGRKFQDYADCSAVRTQRPYYAAQTAQNAEKTDPRLTEPTYAKELAWVKSQVESAACTCCHSKAAPEGFSNWYVEQPGNFLNGFYDKGIAMGAGWIESGSFGAYPPSENNGFTRATPENPTHSIFPSTDNARMVKFFENEALLRGIKKETYAGTYAAGPLDEQRFYVPKACGPGEGIEADGTLRWRLGGARYVYVLDANAKAPGVPPNLDFPTGTIWRMDVSETGTPVETGTVKFGVVNPGLTQRFPAGNTAPKILEKGKTYYLYVMADVAQPNTRCLATIP